LNRFLSEEDYIREMNRLHKEVALVGRYSDAWLKTDGGIREIEKSGLFRLNFVGSRQALPTFSQITRYRNETGNHQGLTGNVIMA
jgi:hypothetical protein